MLRSIENNLQIYDFSRILRHIFLCVRASKENLSPASSTLPFGPDNEAKRKFLFASLGCKNESFVIFLHPKTLFLTTFLCESSGRKVKVYKSFLSCFLCCSFETKRRKREKVSKSWVVLNGFAMMREIDKLALASRWNLA